MITINANDLPVTIAEKLITVKCYTDDELLEIAAHLVTYCEHQRRRAKNIGRIDYDKR